MTKISPSQISNLLECPRCLWLQFHEGIKRPEGIFPSLPSGMDGVFKKYFDSFRASRALPPEIKGKVEGKLFTDEEKLKVWQNNFKGLHAEFPQYDLLLKGAIDDVLVSKEGKYIPFDFKTRGYPLKEDTHQHYQTQLNLYALLFEKNGLPPTDFGYLLFFYPKSYLGEGTTNFAHELVKMTVNPRDGEAILQKVQKILTGPKPIAHEACAFCLYRQYEE